MRYLSKDKHIMDMLQAAVRTFFHRASSMIQLPFFEKYQDSLEEIVRYIQRSSSFIHSLLQNNNIAPPFCIDLVVIPQKVVEALNKNEDDEEDDDSDFDDDDDSDDDEDEDSKNEYDPFDAIPDVQTKLEQNNTIYEKREIPKNARPRVFNETFTALRNKTNNEKNKGTNFAMPHRQRICIIADRRKGPKDNDKDSDTLFMYKPPISGDIPSSNVPEWYFQASFDCLIPGKRRNDIITAKSSAKGYLLCFSFHILSKEEIKCYLYTRGQMVRFMPIDVATLLPELFVINANNAKFIEHEKKTGDIAKSIKLTDKPFEKFRERVQGTLNSKKKLI